MPTAYKVLGQLASAATTNETLDTCPASTQTVVSTLVVCNRAASAKTYRIAIRKDGATLATSQYIAFDVAIAANDSTALTLGITIDAADIITVYASSADLTFTAFGSELT